MTEKISIKKVGEFENNLIMNEKSLATIKKYIKEIRNFLDFLDGGDITKTRVMQYRAALQPEYKAQTINVKLSAVNAFLDFIGRPECRVRFIKVQKKSFVEEEKELREEEYKTLLLSARERGKIRLYHILLTLCSTGIRISELKYITADAVQQGRAEIDMKGKHRVILLPNELKNKLKEYMDQQNITYRKCVYNKKWKTCRPL